MMRSKERASGIPWDMPLLPEWTESRIDFCFDSPEMDEVDDATCAGRRYPRL